MWLAGVGHEEATLAQNSARVAVILRHIRVNVEVALQHSPMVGIEPTTTGLKVLRSTN